jgi:3-methyladenine DNA glycosylase/8-oxoguanine DNA glycosylase
MEITLDAKDIRVPYDFGYSLTHYVIPPWIAENNKLSRVFILDGRPFLAVISSSGTVDNPLLKVKITGGGASCKKYADRLINLISYCLGLKEDHEDFYEYCCRDSILKEAVSGRRGSRVIVYPTLAEALIGVICAQNTVFKRIYSMMSRLCERFGETIVYAGRKYHSFPDMKTLADADIAEIRACSVGYRDKFIKGVAEYIVKNKIDAEKLKLLPFPELRDNLLKMPGVGPYTADLALSAAVRDVDVMHLDKFVRAAMKTFFFDGKDLSDEAMLEYAEKNWKGFKGLVADALTTDTQIWSSRLGIDFKYKSGAAI